MAEAKEKIQAVNLSTLSPAKGARHRRKRLGIGEGSGSGKTCGRGQKGQKARSGAPIRAGFEGGQMPLHRRLPKIGFTSRKKVRGENVFDIVPLAKLIKLGSEDEVTLEMLRQSGLVSAKAKQVKILGGCQCDRSMVVHAHACSASARAAIEEAGGKVKLV